MFELQLINTAARDLMVERIYQFIQQYSKQSNNNLNTLDYLVPSSLLNSPIATNQINIEVEP